MTKLRSEKLFSTYTGQRLEQKQRNSRVDRRGRLVSCRIGWFSGFDVVKRNLLAANWWGEGSTTHVQFQGHHCRYSTVWITILLMTYFHTSIIGRGWEESSVFQYKQRFGLDMNITDKVMRRSGDECRHPLYYSSPPSIELGGSRLNT